MNFTLGTLIQILHTGNHSLVVANGDVFTFDGRGVSDLFRLFEENPELLHGASIADKVVGKAAVALMVLGGVKELYADIISQLALDWLGNNGIKAKHGSIVPYIINRDGTGLCPLENRCLSCETSQECLVRIRAFMKEIKQKTERNDK